MKKNSIVWLSLLIVLSTISFIYVKPAHAPSTTVFVDPAAIIDDTKTPGSNFTVSINVSDVIDLYSYQVIIMWEPAMLDCTLVTYGDFFAANEPWVFESSRINNTEGWAGFVISLMMEVPGVNGSGWLGSFEFLVEDYGSTALAHDYPPRDYLTYLLDSDGFDIPFTAVDGYFSNVPGLPGDADGDGDVDYADLFILAEAYGSSLGQPAYDARADFDNDDDVDYDDLDILAANYGQSV